MATEKPRTPLLLILLALLVVAVVYFVYDKGRSGYTRDLDRWSMTPLDATEIRERLTNASAEAGDVCHALIQLERAAAAGDPGETILKLADLLPGVYSRGDDRSRQLSVFAARSFRGGAVRELLDTALGDDASAVRLEAAVGLASLRDVRAAEPLADAIEAVRPDHVQRKRELLRAYALVAREDHRSRIVEWLRVARIDDDKPSIGFCEAAIESLKKVEPSHEGGR